jgi:hypothetical protein
MALNDLYLAANDPRVVGQVTAAIYQAAATIYTESNPPANHATRATFATKVATGTVSLQPLILSTCAFASLTTSSTDTTVNNAVASLWNLWAGA